MITIKHINETLNEFELISYKSTQQKQQHNEIKVSRYCLL